jgi:DNA-binding winged helix-turn-helix (wHTH) protein
MSDGATRIYRFGPFVLDVADRSLKRHGAPIPLTPKIFDLLVALVENAGRLVEKDALLRTVWPDVAVEEGNLTKGVFMLRQVFETEGGLAYIESVPKRGYRFMAPVSVAQEQPVSVVSPMPSSQTAAPENSLAVMPFTDMSAARDHEYFCEGMRAGRARCLVHLVFAVSRQSDRYADDWTGAERHVAARGQRP